MPNAYSYMVTSRTIDTSANPEAPYTDRTNIVAQPDGGLSFFTATGAYNTTPSEYSIDSSTVTNGLPEDFASNLTADLTNASQPRLVLFIHGLANPWDAAVTATAAYGAGLVAGSVQGSATPEPIPSSVTDGTLEGVVIGFSWPSFDAVDSIAHYPAYLWKPFDDWTPGHECDAPTTRGNIVASNAALVSLLQSLTTFVQGTPGASLDVVCHSEGNFMMMSAAASVSDTSSAGINIDNTVHLAADFNSSAFQPQDGTTVTYTSNALYYGPGSGQNISALSNAVWVFRSENDSELSKANDIPFCHNPVGKIRMGYAGPDFSNTVMSNVTAIDCSTVVDGVSWDELTPIGKDYKAGWIPDKLVDTDVYVNSHDSYRYVPQLLWVTSQILNGSTSSLYNVSLNGQSGTMSYDDPT